MEQESMLGELLGAPTACQPVEHVRASRAYMDAIRKAAYHSDPQRYALMYRVLWRINHGCPELMKHIGDADVDALIALEKEVRRDAHKMKAFVRFKRVEDAAAPETFVAWHRPDHPIVEVVAPFFQDRFRAMNFTIFTPTESVRWDGHALHFGPGIPREQAPAADELDEMWRTYYASIFNPARIKIRAMQSEMPQKHWQTLPEAQIIRQLLRQAPERVRAMLGNQPETAAAFVPEQASLTQLARALPACLACQRCTQANGAVPGEGPPRARIMLVGEQPGDQEDLVGRPFVGPAGEVLNQALTMAGIERSQCYLTNAFKAFKHAHTPERRLHQTPSPAELAVCKPWLLAEIKAVSPHVLVALGGSAALATMGRRVAVLRERGEHPTSLAPHLIVSAHPASILRAPSESMRQHHMALLIRDLRAAAALAAQHP